MDLCLIKEKKFPRTTADQRIPHKVTPLRAAPYFRPDSVHDSLSRDPLAGSHPGSIAVVLLDLKLAAATIAVAELEFAEAKREAL